MLRNYKLVLTLWSVLSVSVFASNTFTFYPNQKTFIRQSFESVPLDQGHIRLSNLPSQMDADSFKIEYPTQVDNWRIYTENTNPFQWTEQLNGSAVRVFQGVGKWVSGQFLFRDGDHAVVLIDGKAQFTPLVNVEIESPPQYKKGPLLDIFFPFTTHKSIDLSISYLFSSIQSSVEYQLLLDNKTKTLSLLGNLIIENQNDLSFNQYKVRVFTGETRFLNPAFRSGFQLASESRMMMKSQPESSDSDYYIFELLEPVSVPANCIFVTPLFSKKELSYKKVYRYSAPTYVANSGSIEPIDLILMAKNDAGFPLPTGKIRLYEDDNLIAEDYFKPMARREEREIKFGKVIEIVGSKKIIAEKRVSKTSRELEVSLEVSNLKMTQEKIQVVDTLPSTEYKILESSVPFTELGNARIEFEIQVNPGDSKTITYRVALP